MAAAQRKLWSEIDGEAWIDNPRRRKHKRGRKHRGRFKKGSAAAKRYMASIRPKGRKRHHSKEGTVKHRRHGRRQRGRRHFRRNPPAFVRGWTGRLMDGVKGGLAVLGGEAVVSAVPKLIPVPMLQVGFMNVIAEALTAVFTAPLVAKMIGPKWAQVYLYGGFARPMKGLVIGANIPILSPALAAYPGSLMALPASQSLAATFDATTLEAEEASVM